VNLNPFRHKDLPSLDRAEREVVDEFRRLEQFSVELILQLASWTAADVAYDPTLDAYSASTTVQEALEDHAAALDAHEGAGGTTRHPVFTTAAAGFAPATGSLVDASAYFLAANGNWIGHRTVGGTSEHAVFTTSVAGFVPAPSTATGKYLKDNGTWDTPGGGGATFGWGEAVLATDTDFDGSTTGYNYLSNANFTGGLAVNVTRTNGGLSPSGMSGLTIRARATVNITFNLDAGSVSVSTLLYVRFYNASTAAQFGSGELITTLKPYTTLGKIPISFSTVGSVGNGEIIVATFKWTTTAGAAVSQTLRYTNMNFTLEPIGQ